MEAIRPPPMPPSVLIACHAGSGIGLGHLMRSLVAGRALQDELGAKIQFLIQGDGVDAGLLSDFPYRLIPQGVDWCDALRDDCSHQRIDAVLLDLFPRLIPRSMGQCLSEIRDLGIKLVGIDGLVAYRDVLDLVFFPSFRMPSGADSMDASLVFGWDCFLLNVPEAIPAWSHGHRVLALTGGSDVTRLGQTWPSILNDRLPSGVELDWVTGPYAQAPVWPAEPRIAMRRLVAQQGLGGLMAQTHYAVTVYGVSFFELLYCGIPTVVFSPYGGKDDAELAHIADAGVALVARDESEATDLLVGLMANPAAAIALSQRAKKRLVQRGGRRLAQEVARLLQ